MSNVESSIFGFILSMFYLFFSAQLEAAPSNQSRRQGEFMTAAHSFYGYLGCYIFSLYGKRTGTLTKLTVKEVEDAEGNENKGYLINVSSRIVLLLLLD